MNKSNPYLIGIGGFAVFVAQLIVANVILKGLAATLASRDGTLAQTAGASLGAVIA